MVINEQSGESFLFCFVFVSSSCSGEGGEIFTTIGLNFFMVMRSVPFNDVVIVIFSYLQWILLHLD